MADVAIFQANATGYSDEPPYHPSERYPEIRAVGLEETGTRNFVYGSVRQTLRLLGLDSARFGSGHWNPLERHIRRGDKVVIKPNFVMHEFSTSVRTQCRTTHGSIIRAVVDYAYLAAGPESSIVIADAPLQGANFELLLQQAGIPEIQDYYWRKLRYEIKIYDLRQIYAAIDEGSSFIKNIKALAGDPCGYRNIDMGSASRLCELDTSAPRYAVGDYDSAATGVRHQKQHHEYVVSNTVLNADTILSVPKLKTHNKVGVTVCLKNLVGIIGSKDCLPHHRLGKTNKGGDEFPEGYPMAWYISQKAYTRFQGRVPLRLWRALRFAAAQLLGAGTPQGEGDKAQRNRFFPSGSWHGNDTIWRTVDDLNRILFYYDESANELAECRQRRFFAIVDGIVGMEGNGPLRGSPKASGVLLAGDDPLAIDVVAATLMGFDWRRLRMLKGIVESPSLPKYSEFSGDDPAIAILSNQSRWDSMCSLKQCHLAFSPPAGWRQHIEV